MVHASLPNVPPVESTSHLPPLLTGESLDEFHKMLKGELYIAVDPYLMRMRSRCEQLCYGPESLTEAGRTEMLREMCTLEGVNEKDHGVYVARGLVCEYGFNIRLGKEIYIGPRSTLIDVGIISIGSRSMLGANVQLYTPTHPTSPEERNGLKGPEGSKPIIIGNDVWIGGSVIICPGVTIGDGSTVGAGSVVTRDIPERSVAVGNPARVIKRIELDGRSTDLRAK